MIVLDTSVLSDVMKAAPAPSVLAWMSDQAMASLFKTTITQAETLNGLTVLPAGQRCKLLTEAAQAMFLEDFAG
ncbi:PIN domain-containing protein [Kozakia baliensis]|uniref:twitching motility protein PilT n=1 Tax=Kozakia baliensis TaxID=153496 RepID=UPI001F1D26E5|nr:twitching motility protein PilT [Kozakia baliensis]